MLQRGLRKAIATAGVSGLIVTALVAAPASAAGSVTVHVGCGGDSAAKKLVAAVRDANARAPKTTILYLKPGCNYAFYRAHSFPVDGVRANALQVIRIHLVIHGQGATISRRAGAARFRLLAIAESGRVAIDNLTMSGGRARNGQPGASHLGSDGEPGNTGTDGGAIYNLGTLRLDDVVFDDNQAGRGGNGGSGQQFDGEDPTTPGGNGAWPGTIYGGNAGWGGRGGAIYSEGSLHITNSTFTNNAAGDGGTGGDAYAGKGADGAPGDSSNGFVGGNGSDGGFAQAGAGGVGGDGGAIYSYGPLTIDGSTLSNNHAGSGTGGGAAYAGDGGDGANNGGDGGFGGSANSITGGRGGDGGAILVNGVDAIVTNDTISTNAAGNGGNVTAQGGDGGDGGCEGDGGDGGTYFAGIASRGVDALHVVGGGSADTSGTVQAGNVDGSDGAALTSSGGGGADGSSCS